MSEIIVDINGSGDFTTITAAIASAVAQDKIVVLPGIYANEAGPNGYGLELKADVHLDGVSQANVIVQGVDAPAGQEHLYSTIHKGANCKVSNMTLLADKAKYCVHQDTTSDSDMHFEIENITAEHLGGGPSFGYGLIRSQMISMSNVTCLGTGGGVYFHGAYFNRRTNEQWKVNMSNVSGDLLSPHDFLEYVNNLVVMDGCNFNKTQLTVRDTYYENNPNDPNFNRGYHNQSLRFKTSGCDFGTVVYANQITEDIFCPFRG